MQTFDLDTPLINLTRQKTAEDKEEPPKIHWTIRHAVEGVQIFGGIGSGKTSGSGCDLAMKFLAAQFGGLVLTAKPDEKETWVKYCKDAGRFDDLIIVEPDGKYFFNFLDYEMAAADEKNAFTENIVEVLKTVINASAEKDGGGGNDPFWENALDMLIFNIIDLCILAYDKVSIQTMYDVVQSLPKKPAPKENATVGDKKDKAEKRTPSSAYDLALSAALKKANSKIPEWRKKQSEERLQMLDANDAAMESAIENEVPEARLFSLVDQFIEKFVNLGDKTRMVIDFSFTGFLFRMLRDPVYSLFCSTPSNFTPDASRSEGKIILLNLPVKKHHKIGRDCQVMFKYIWQRAMEKKEVADGERPVFLWADEAQHFLHEHDAEFQATARSSKIATVYLSQNLPNYYASMGGEKSEFRVKSFLGTLNTKFFHANADIETNRYASELIGEKYKVDVSKGETQGKEFGTNRNRSLKKERIVPPEKFAQLKTGGHLNERKVECYMHVQGNLLKSANHKLMVFTQKEKST